MKFNRKPGSNKVQLNGNHGNYLIRCWSDYQEERIPDMMVSHTFVEVGPDAFIKFLADWLMKPSKAKFKSVVVFDPEGYLVLEGAFVPDDARTFGNVPLLGYISTWNEQNMMDFLWIMTRSSQPLKRITDVMDSMSFQVLMAKADETFHQDSGRLMKAIIEHVEEMRESLPYSFTKNWTDVLWLLCTRGLDLQKVHMQERVDELANRVIEHNTLLNPNKLTPTQHG